MFLQNVQTYFRTEIILIIWSAQGFGTILSVVHSTWKSTMLEYYSKIVNQAYGRILWFLFLSCYLTQQGQLRIFLEILPTIQAQTYIIKLLYAWYIIGNLSPWISKINSQRRFYDSYEEIIFENLYMKYVQKFKMCKLATMDDIQK